MSRTAFGLLFITTCVVLGRCGYSYFESDSGFCADEPPQTPERELWYLTFSERAWANKKVVQAFTIAARQWRSVGITIVVQGYGSPDRRAEASNTILADTDSLQCYIDEDTLGLGAFVRKSRTAFDFLGRAILCVENLEGGYSENSPLWTSVAQHELGHALGLWHHYGSVMKPEVRVCPDPGFTEQDIATIYDTLLVDRVIAEPRL